MKRLGTIEKFGVLLAVALIAFGIYCIIHPTEGYVPHPGHGRVTAGHEPPPIHVTSNGARVHGVISIAFGAGLVWSAFYKPRK